VSGFEIRIDDPRTPTLPERRAAEWRALAADLAEAIRSLDDRSGSWTVHSDGSEFAIVSESTAGVERVPITRSELDALFVEYLEVVTQLGSSDSDGFSRMDALDMAKKVTHDRAGRVLKRQLRPLQADHEVARRVFSLLAALVHDTSDLSGVHAALAQK